MKILHIDSSIMSEQSVSRQLTAAIVQHFSDITANLEVISRDLAAQPVTHLSAAEFLATRGVEPQDEAAKQDVAKNSQLVSDFLSADIIVIGAPMYNFTIPSQLKSWLDRLAVAGKTFRYTEKGPEGLAGSKRVIIVSSRSGVYSEGSPVAAMDHQETYLRVFLGFLGVTNITFIRAEGLAITPESRSTAINAALVEIAKLSV